MGPDVPHTMLAAARRVGEENGFVFTSHAIERMWERRIDPDLVPIILAHPEVRVLAESGAWEGRRYYRIWGTLRSGRRVYVCLTEDKKYVISVGWREAA